MISRLLLLSFTSLLLLAFPTASAQDAAAGVKVGGLNFETGDKWTAKASRGMVKAQLSYKAAVDADPVDAKFYFFGPGQGGSVKANVQRWIGQFDPTAAKPEVKEETIKVGEKEYTLLNVKGTYLDGPPFGGAKVPRADWALLGAILPGKEGPVFIKMVGPGKLVTACNADMKALCASALE